MTEKEIKAIDCMAMHLQSFFDQSSDKRTANCAEPCSLCERFEECGCDSFGTMEPLLRQSNVPVSVQLAAQRRKWGEKKMNCKDCKLVQNLNAQNKQLEKENDTLLKIMNATFSLTVLWAKKEGLIKSGLDTKEDIDKELADGKEKIRALFNDIIKTGEPAFVDGFFRALDLPENFQHFI